MGVAAMNCFGNNLQIRDKDKLVVCVRPRFANNNRGKSMETTRFEDAMELVR